MFDNSHMFDNGRILMTPARRPDRISTGILMALLLLSLLIINHFLVVITYLSGQSPFGGLFVVSTGLAIGLNYLLAGHWGIDRKRLLIAAGYSVAVLVCSLLVSAWYFDLSWDGQWYQQQAVYDLAGHWNPLWKPMGIDSNKEVLSILHFPKSSWYFGAAVMQMTGSVEAGKAYNILLLVAAAGIMWDLGRSTMLAALVVLNPVVWSELPTYLNDGDLYLLFVTWLAATVCWIRGGGRIYLAIAAMAAICLVNSKFTGLVFWMVAAVFLFAYLLIERRDRIKGFLLSHMVIGILAVCVFGWNPYMSNLVYRNQPLYPLMGSQQYPSVFAGGKDDNEAYETPLNMRGKSLAVRLFYANFGCPGNAPYNREDSARLVCPFVTSPASWAAYHYHETRVSGFGPYFGLELIVAFLLLPLVLQVRRFRWGALLSLAGLVVGLSLSRHFWWPRFFPLLWLMPLLLVYCCWLEGGWLRRTGGWIVVVLALINGGVVAVVHMEWESRSSLNLHQELHSIQAAKKAIEIDYGYFRRSMEEKLQYRGIPFMSASLHAGDPGVFPLTSVVEGYPNQVYYRYVSSGK